MPPAAPPSAAPGDTTIAAAHARLVADGTVQLELPDAKLATEAPGWLADFFRWLGERPDIVKFVFWAGVAVIVALLLKLIYDRLSAHGLRFGSANGAAPRAGWWRPEAGHAQVLLSEADALAADGRYAEAAHLLLLRSVDDIDRRCPGEVRPSLTARDIARLPALPADVARAFGLIAGVVEASLFGGSAVAAGEWGRARAAYQGIAT